MHNSARLVLAGARYTTRSDAVGAFKNVWSARHKGDYDHMAVAVLRKDGHGRVRVERHNSTTKHLECAGALVGAALASVAPPGAVVRSVATGAGVGAVIGGIVGHFWHMIPNDNVAQMGEVLRSGESGLVIVAVNKKDADITPLLTYAEEKAVIETKASYLDAAFEQVLRKVSPEHETPARFGSVANG
jgi:uncharacterized membrane protein